MGKKPVFWVIGGPGSGKGTQCYQLSMRYKLAHLSTGEILRAEVGSKSELGKQIHAMVSNGQLVPRDIGDFLFRKRLDGNSFWGNLKLHCNLNVNCSARSTEEGDGPGLSTCKRLPNRWISS